MAEKLQEDSLDESSRNEYSMEKLLALQNKIGTKAFKNKLIEIKKERKNLKQNGNFIKIYKNAPSEFPLLRGPAPKILPKDLIAGSKNPTKLRRDPRFDNPSGSFDPFVWKQNYKFISEIRQKEKLKLEEALKEENNQKEGHQLKLQIQKIKNKERQEQREENKRAEKKREREAAVALMKDGIRPRYTKQKEKYLAHKVSHFEELVKNNKLHRYLQRKEKKLLKRGL